MAVLGRALIFLALGVAIYGIAAKKAASPSSTAVAYGAISRRRRRVTNRIRLDHSDSSSSHSNSEPSCDDHTAVAR